jgi:UDP-2-acetamido-3-amino-2,3-dideoxy-glucuronate N-acetyltransferase
VVGVTVINETADVDSTAEIGDGCIIWHLAQIREQAVLGKGCVIGRGAYIGSGVQLGDHVKVQNYALVYEPAVIGDGVFIGPGVVLTNDRNPRATSPSGDPKSTFDWVAEGVRISNGASIGAQSVILAGTVIGAWAMVGAGSVVLRDIPNHALVVGNPAQQIGWVSRSGRRLVESDSGWSCLETGERYRLEGTELTYAGSDSAL